MDFTPQCSWMRNTSCVSTVRLTLVGMADSAWVTACGHLLLIVFVENSSSSLYNLYHHSILTYHALKYFYSRGKVRVRVTGLIHTLKSNSCGEEKLYTGRTLVLEYCETHNTHHSYYHYHCIKQALIQAINFPHFPVFWCKYGIGQILRSASVTRKCSLMSMKIKPLHILTMGPGWQ